MSLMTPWAFAAALILAVPPLVILYMLRLRRAPRQVSSTLLWRKSVEDLVANTPFQRLRWSILLLLQLLALVLIALALGRPVDRGAAGVTGRVIVLIDQSASMAATIDDGAGTSDGGTAATSRLDVARREVEALVDGLGRDDTASQMMVVAFGREPRVLSGFERSRERLRAALAGLAQTDEEADLEAALALADGFARVGGEEEADVELPVVIIVTDGSVVEPRRSETFRSNAAEVRFLRVGPDPENPAIGGTDDRARDNVGIVAVAAERSFESPTMVSFFARLSNSAVEPVETTLVIRADDRVIARRSVVLPAAERIPGELTILEQLELPDRAVLVIEHTHRDRLAADDVAALVIPAPRSPRIVIVSENGMDPFLREVLEGAEPETLLEHDLASWQALEATLSEIDLVIFDRVAPPNLPSIPSLTIGALPPEFDAGPVPDGGRRAIGWSRQHPLLRHVDLDDLVYSGTGGLLLPDGAEALAQGPDGPIMAAMERRGVRHAVIAFALRASNLPVLPTFPVLIQNALEHLGAGGAGQAGRVAQPGDVIVVTARRDADEIVVIDGRERRSIPRSEGPDGADGRDRGDRADALDRRVVLPRFSTAGVRRVEGAEPPDDLVAISVLSERESDLSPRPLPPLATASAAAATSDQRRELWPWAALLALVALTVEWFVYLRRAGRP